MSEPYVAWEVLLDEAQYQTLRQWQKAQDEKVKEMQRQRPPFNLRGLKPEEIERSLPYYGCTGGAYTYHVTYTSLGEVLTVTNNLTKEEIDLTDYESW